MNYKVIKLTNFKDSKSEIILKKSQPDFYKKYFELKELGYTSQWVGENQIKMVLSENSSPKKYLKFVETPIKDGSNLANTIKVELESAIKKYFTKKIGANASPEELSYYLDYIDVVVTEKDDHYYIEINTDLGYHKNDLLGEHLNPIIEKYDKNAYFDLYDAYTLVAWISK